MKIVTAAFAYNERPYIPFMVEYYREQGCDLFILDNYSTDGTYEWLIEHGVTTARVDTRDSFLLVKLQATLLAGLRKIKPDWVVYCGIDSYYCFKGTIREEIEKAESLGYNMIEVNHFSMYNTGEKFQLPFTRNYFYGANHRRLQMIGKFVPTFKFVADALYMPNKKVYVSDGMFVNYGMCKPRIEREITFARRKRAWLLGEYRGHGVHYAPAQRRQWIWSKEELIDIRTTEFFKLMK